jgi:spore germination protein GerM
LSFRTGDITRQVLETALTQKAANENYLPLASTNTKINSMYLGDDKIVYADFSPELVTEMNAGAGIELQIIQCITNTLGSYYGTDRVYITIDGKPYESGHLLMKKGETFKVDMDNVIR